MAIRKLTKEEYQKEFGVAPRVNAPQPEAQPEEGGNFLTGLAKSGLSTAKGTLKIGEKIANLVLPKSIEPGEFVSDLEKTELGKKYFTEEALETRGTGEKIGKFAGDVAQFAIPATKVATATKALSTIPRIGARALTSGAVGAAQTGELKGGAVAAGTEAIAPGAAKAIGKVVSPVTRLMGRLLRGTGTALSGMSSAQMKAILDNPRAAKAEVQAIKKIGGAETLRQRSKELVEGVSGVRQEARKAYKEGLETLAETDINPTVFKEQIGTTLNKFGSNVKNGIRTLGNVEFDDPKNIKRASELVDKLSKVGLDGKSLRKLADDIESSAYKIATSDERLAFNAFVKELSGSLKNAISGSTSKLDEINQAFSQEMQLADEVQKILGKVKFKNAREILAVSQRLEGLFNQKGLAPEAIDKLLTRIGIEPTGFRGAEAARQAGELAERPNAIGTNPFEIIRAFTAAVVPPSGVRWLATTYGIGEEVAKEWVTKLSPAARGVLIRTIIGGQNPGNEIPD